MVLGVFWLMVCEWKLYVFFLVGSFKSLCGYIMMVVLFVRICSEGIWREFLCGRDEK